MKLQLPLGFFKGIDGGKWQATAHASAAMPAIYNQLKSQSS